MLYQKPLGLRILNTVIKFNKYLVHNDNYLHYFSGLKRVIKL